MVGYMFISAAVGTLAGSLEVGLLTFGIGVLVYEFLL